MDQRTQYRPGDSSTAFAGPKTARHRLWESAQRRLAFAFALGMACGPCFGNAFDFEAPFHVRSSAVSQGHAVAVGDVNGDGRDDVVATQGDSKVAIHLQAAGGELQAAQVHTLTVGAVRVLKVLDIDRDGASELVAGHRRGLAVYSPARGWRYVPSATDCQVLAAGDIDRNGWIDIACLGSAGNVSLYDNDQHGTFQAPRYMWTPAYGGEGSVMQVRLKDVTGDGYPDLTVLAEQTAGLYVHWNVGNGEFFPAYGYPQPEWDQFSPGGFEFIDVDADGVDEMLTTSRCNSPCAALNIFRIDSLGHPRYVRSFPTYDLPSTPVVHDLDRDGKVDLLVPHDGWFAVGRYMAEDAGLSTRELRNEVPIDVQVENVMALGDINGDACTDLVVANSHGMSIMHGKCLSTTDNDYDGDFESDVFWRNATTGQNVIWRSANAGLAQTVRGVAGTAWQVVGHGDFDHDGRVDILWRNGATGANAIWKGGNYTTQQPVRAVTDVRWRVAAVGDFDGDRRADILWRHATTGVNAIWKSGNAATQQPISSVTDVRWEVVGVGDFNDDMRSDILWRHSATGANTIWKSGNHATPQAVAKLADVRWQVAGVGDFLGFGVSDILWRHSGTGQNVIWPAANDQFEHPVTAVTNLAWQVAAVGDYDGDRISDLFWRNTATGANVIWRSANSATQLKVAAQAGSAWNMPGQ